MNITKRLLPGALMIGACALVAGFAFASPTENSTTVQLDVLPSANGVCIGATGSFDFGDFNVSNVTQTVTGAFVDYFWVEDLKGADSGYYTTVQLSGDLVGPGGATIGAENVYMQTILTGNAAITTMTGSANTLVEVAAGMSSWLALDSAQTLIKRDTAANFGVLGQYGTLPEMRVDIPAYTPVGSYSVTLTYTLYEN